MSGRKRRLRRERQRAKADAQLESHCMITYTGAKINLAHPCILDIRIEDISHALSLICRFGGHTSKFYSVAQHCCQMADLVDDEFKLQALLSDAPCAYLGEPVGPLAKVSIQYLRYRDLWAHVIAERFSISSLLRREVRCADDVAQAIEARDLMSKGTNSRVGKEPYCPGFTPWSSEKAEETYIAYFAEYYKGSSAYEELLMGLSGDE